MALLAAWRAIVLLMEQWSCFYLGRRGASAGSGQEAAWSHRMDNIPRRAVVTQRDIVIVSLSCHMYRCTSETFNMTLQDGRMMQLKAPCSWSASPSGRSKKSLTKKRSGPGTEVKKATSGTPEGEGRKPARRCRPTTPLSKTVTSSPSRRYQRYGHAESL